MKHLTLTVRERIKIRDSIEAKNITEDVWPLLARLLEENEFNRRRATDLAWIIEDQTSFLVEEK